MAGIVFSLLLKRGSPNRTSFREIIAVGCGVPARKAVAVAGEGIEKERFCLPVVDYLFAHRARSAVGVEVDDVGIYHYSSKIPRLHRNALCGHGEVEMVGVIPIDVGIRSIKLPIIVMSTRWPASAEVTVWLPTLKLILPEPPIVEPVMA